MNLQSSNANKVTAMLKSRPAIIAFVVIILSGVIFLSHSVIGQDSENAQNEAAEPAQFWTVRCNKNEDGTESRKPGSCEIFQRLVVQESGQRVAEFAIGFPADQDNARGVVILPLGILLEPGMQMIIDEGEPFTFRPRYCNANGCFAFLSLSDELLEKLKRGSQASILFLDTSGQTIRVNMSLKGITKALEEIG